MKARALVAGLMIAAAPLSAQEEGPSRPGFLAAMGLLETREVRIEEGAFPPFAIELPISKQVAVQRAELPPDAEDVLATWDFVTPEGRVVESLSITVARVDPAPPQARRFAMANLLVLRSFGELAARHPKARLAGFGPVDHDGGLDAVHAVGTFGGESGRRFFFRHVGLLTDETDAALVVICTLRPDLMPVRSQAQMRDTYTGRAIDSIRVLGAE
jgi:hypothetical protein